jgi:hypothetical protein
MMRIAAGIIAALLAAAGFAQVAKPTLKIERGEACVAPVAEMRRDHMKMLMHQRDRTMRLGVRETRFSLKGCVDCHASRDTGSVLGKEGFCSSCHEYAAVKMDCFECHTPLRQSAEAAR